jgi:hypothetical protein|tara:strand:+ start:2916 stop:3335 length:420 start_codon:yes stop_codon:yes gene_type:complete
MAKTPTSNIEKALSGGGPNEVPLDMKEVIKLADAEKIEFDVMQNLIDAIQEDFENERKPGESLIDWLKTKPTEYFKRIELKDGGNVFFISDYLKSKEKPKIKEIDLAGMFTPGKTLSSLTEAEREAVNNLLKLTLGKKD